MTTKRQMITKRLSADAIQDAARPVVALSTDYPAGELLAPHRHPRAQLIHAGEGLMTVRAEARAWVVPPGFAVWMPVDTWHEVKAVTALELRTLYVAPRAARGLATACRVVAVPPFLRELILEVARLPLLYDEDGPEGRLVAVLLDRLGALEAAPLDLPVPSDRRLSVVTSSLLDRPGDNRTLAEWGSRAGASGRTLARLFRAQTGMTFREWRGKRRLLAALERLAALEPVTSVALDLGYASPSAFIAMFKREMGQSPRRYLRAGAPPA